MPGFAWRTPEMFAASAETEDDGRCVGDRANGELRREVRETPLPSPAHPDGAKANACTSTDVSFRRIAHHPTAQGMCAESCGLFEDRSFGLACADDRRDADGVKLVFDASSFELCPLRGRPVGDNTHLESLGAKRSDCDDHFRLRCVLRWILDAIVGKQVVNRNPDTQLRPQLCKELLTGVIPISVCSLDRESCILAQSVDFEEVPRPQGKSLLSIEKGVVEVEQCERHQENGIGDKARQRRLPRAAPRLVRDGEETVAALTSTWRPSGQLVQPKNRKISVMEATCSHPVADATVFSKQRARRRRRTSCPWATSTRQAWRRGRKILAPCSLRGGSSQPTRRTS